MNEFMSILGINPAAMPLSDCVKALSLAGIECLNLEAYAADGACCGIMTFCTDRQKALRIADFIALLHAESSRE